MYDAVVFDNDGVLTRPTASTTVRAAVRRAYRDCGVEPTAETVDAAVDGSPGRVASACANHDIDREAFWRRREARAAAAQRRAMEQGAKPLYDDVATLSDLDVPLAVVSNNQHETVEHVLDVFGLDDRFETAYGREADARGVRRKKPSPYYLNRALTDLAEFDVENALYVGDSNVDLVAAKRAGIEAAFVRRPHRADYSLARQPTHELTSLSGLRRLVG
jgi:HAD superfamily hydrolase (TIGR01549 family)